MTSDSRVEVVNAAIQKAASANLTYEQIAQAAIEASDAWIAAQIAAQDPIAFRRTKSPRIEGLDAITRRILD